MAELVPAIHVFLASVKQDVDARHKAGHDVEALCPTLGLRYGDIEYTAGDTRCRAKPSKFALQMAASSIAT
jgi:hypothetical protein